VSDVQLRMLNPHPIHTHAPDWRAINMTFMKCVRIGVLAVIPAAAAACGTPTGPTPQSRPAVAHQAPDAAAKPNLRSGYVLASGRTSTTVE